MIRTVSIVQWVILVGILGFPFWRGYRSGRIVRSTVYLTWFLLTAHTLAFCLYGLSLSRSDRAVWGNSFPEGTHVLAYAVFGWFYGLIMAVVALGVRKALRGEPIFQSEKRNSQNREPDA